MEGVVAKIMDAAEVYLLLSSNHSRKDRDMKNYVS